MFRGGGILLDLLDIAGGATGSFTAAIGYSAQQTALGTGTSCDYAPADQGGRWAYIALNTTGIIFRFDVKYRGCFPWTSTPIQTGTAAVGNRLFITTYVNPESPTEKLSKIHVQSHLSTSIYRSEAII
jgi:hypothetical protein